MAKQNPNPQGKGLVPVMARLQQHLQLPVAPKTVAQVEMELFTSLFVLQSEIRCNPAVGQVYWLYRRSEGYRLSLVGPTEWHKTMPHRFIGRCELMMDRTWTLELAEEVAGDEQFMVQVELQRAALQQALEQAPSLEDALPGFMPNLSYQGRILAFILGRSLRTSMQLAGIAALSYREARGLLTGAE